MPLETMRYDHVKNCEKMTNQTQYSIITGNICEVLIFANFARKTNLRTQKSHDFFHYISDTKEKLKFMNFTLREKSQNKKIAKI